MQIPNGLYSISIEIKDGKRGHATGVVVLCDGRNAVRTSFGTHPAPLLAIRAPVSPQFSGLTASALGGKCPAGSFWQRGG